MGCTEEFKKAPTADIFLRLTFAAVYISWPAPGYREGYWTEPACPSNHRIFAYWDYKRRLIYLDRIMSSGLRNSNSQISASISLNGMYVICASEDSRVCIWKYYDSSLYPVQKQKALSGSYEDFFDQHVSIAIPWPGVGFKSLREKPYYDSSMVSKKVVNNLETNLDRLDVFSCCEISPCHSINRDSVQKGVKPTGLASAMSCNLEQNQQPSCQEESLYSSGGVNAASSMLNSYLEDCCSVMSKVRQDQHDGSQLEGRGSATWPEENLPSVEKSKCFNGEKGDVYTAEDLVHQKLSAITTGWGLVIVTAGLEGDIRIFQNWSLPV